jgi:hypothetical protein
MPIFCIPKNLVDKLKESAIKGEVDIKKLYEMSSKERRDLFAKYTDKNVGQLINTKFEEAMISKQKLALKDWASSVFTPQAKTKPVYKNVLDKIAALDELGVLSPKTERAFLQDLVTEKLGITVRPEEVVKITEKAKKINDAQEKLGPGLGDPSKLQENLDFFKAKKEMDDYLLSLTPASNLKILTGTIGRGMMLFSVKSPVLNIGSNIEVGFTEALSRRITNFGIKGADNKLAIDYVKMVNKIYQATGYDLSRMTSLKDTGASGERVLGDTIHTAGKGPVRRVGRFVEDIVFKQMMGAPDVAFSSVHFADSVNLNAMKMAKGDPVLARELMNDAMRIAPETARGEVLRTQGIMDAQTATWTNDSWASNVSQGIRKVMNDVSGDLRVGDYVLPFVKTPANVLATGMDYAGLGIPKALVKTVQAFRSGELKNPEYIKSMSRDLVRSGLGLTGALIIASNLKDEDFVGAYDPKRYQIEQLRGSVYNAFRIGDRWISVDWLGPLSVPVSSIMYARKYGKNGGEKTLQYGKGVLSQIGNLPGISDASEYFTEQEYKKNQSVDEMSADARDYIMEQAFSRLTPSFISDIAKATDKSERVTGGTTLGMIKSRIPGVRETLPEKKNVFGEDVNTQPPWQAILFGARVKVDTEDPVVKEVSDISTETGRGITFTDWDKTTMLSLGQFKEVRGEKIYNEAKVDYGKYLKDNLEQLFKSNEYKDATEDDKIDLINKMDAKAIKRTFIEYGFTYQKSP